MNRKWYSSYDCKKSRPYIFMYQSTNCSTLKENDNQLKWEKKWREIEQHKLLVLLLWFSTAFRKKKNWQFKRGGKISRHLTPCPTGNCVFPVVFISITTTLNAKGQFNMQAQKNKIFWDIFYHNLLALLLRFSLALLAAELVWELLRSPIAVEVFCRLSGAELCLGRSFWTGVDWDTTCMDNLRLPTSELIFHKMIFFLR